VSAGGSKTPSGVAGAETSEQAGEAKSDPRVGIDDLKGMLPDSGK